MMPFFKLFRRNIGTALLVSLGAGLVVFVFVSRSPEKYEGYLSFVILAPRGSYSEEYDYDGYYSLKAAELFAENVVSVMESPSFAHNVLKRTGNKMAEPKKKELENFFTVRRLSSQVVEMSFFVKNPENAEKIAAAAKKEADARIKNLNSNGAGGPNFSLAGGGVLIISASGDPILRAAVAFIVALVLFLGLVVIWDGFKAGE